MVDPKALRLKMGLTQQDFAEVMGCSISTIQKWEGGVSKPNRMARKLLSLLAEREGYDAEV
jgi:DNA-binding transcriptional regulator YiaG